MARKRFNKAQVSANQGQALALRLGGATFRQIASEIGVSVRQAFLYTRNELSSLEPLRREIAERHRELEAQRLDALLLALWDRIDPPQDQPQPSNFTLVGLVRAALAVSARRSKLLGLDAPSKVAQTDTDRRDVPLVELTSAELEKRAEAMKRLAARKGETPPTDTRH